MVLTLTPDGFKTWKLVKPFRVKTSKGFICVPKNTRTDLASSPRIFWSILPPFGRYSQASLVHDYLYSQKTFPRKECDKIFYELMIKYKTYKWKAKLMYFAVRMFGWKAYK